LGHHIRRCGLLGATCPLGLRSMPYRHHVFKGTPGLILVSVLPRAIFVRMDPQKCGLEEAVLQFVDRDIDQQRAHVLAGRAPGARRLGGGSCAFGANNPDILSSIAGTSSSSTTTYVCLAGTSMATPHVAGTLAALRSACATATVDQCDAGEHGPGNYRYPLRRHGDQASHSRRPRRAGIVLRIATSGYSMELRPTSGAHSEIRLEVAGTC
jgi:hypothetical protein